MADQKLTMPEAKKLTSGMAATIRDIVKGHEEVEHSGRECSQTRIKLLAALAHQLDIQAFNSQIDDFARFLDDAWCVPSPRTFRAVPRIYVASSWRNEHQQGVVRDLRIAGFQVYDFKNPAPDSNGFRWSEIDPKWKEWTPMQWRLALEHPIAQGGFHRDMSAMLWADAGVLVLPSGPSSHLEAGFMSGRGKPVYTYVPPGVQPEPDLMYYMLAQNGITMDLGEIIANLKS